MCIRLIRGIVQRNATRASSSCPSVNNWHQHIQIVILSTRGDWACAEHAQNNGETESARKMSV
eukprot:3731444-Rhodomonas_salina.4